MSEKVIRIRVKESTHKRLTELGKIKETYNDIIVRLLDEHDQKKNRGE